MTKGPGEAFSFSFDGTKNDPHFKITPMSIDDVNAAGARALKDFSARMTPGNKRFDADLSRRLSIQAGKDGALETTKYPWQHEGVQ